MNRRIFLATACSAALGTVAWSHPGNGPHNHEIQIDADEAKLLAKDVVAAKVKEGKLGTVWLNIEPGETTPKKFGKKLEWRVIFDNPKMSDVSKRRLYVFLQIDGKLSAVNFTGR
jgi:hypothetical protein